MADDFDSYRNNPDSFGRRLRSSTTFPFTVPNRAKAVWFDAAGTIAVSDADDSSPISGVPVAAGAILNWVPGKVTSVTGPTTIYYTL